ncbi:MAG: peptide chain release factor N(5)-glutamine methyltransferase [Snowella sp.]|nr:peptide chain release factor N(5)-glutamine methyltransferase [Snowella sp.]
MSFWVSGQQLAVWRKQARQAAIAQEISPDEVDWLLQIWTDVDKLSLRLGSFESRSQIPIPQSWSVLNERWQTRLTENCPIQYLAGLSPWRDFVLKVSPAVLIPRPETELIIDWLSQEKAINLQLNQGKWVDLGTGSGAIALGLAQCLPQAKIFAVDTSLDALAIAQENAQSYGLGDRIEFLHGSWWTPLAHFQGQIQGMISNPPYIPTSMIAGLQPEVTQHEPHLALDGGEDGLVAIRHLVETAPDYLVTGGLWLVEIMAGQAPWVAELLENQGQYQGIQLLKDLAGIERFVVAYRI